MYLDLICNRGSVIDRVTRCVILKEVENKRRKSNYFPIIILYYYISYMRCWLILMFLHGFLGCCWKHTKQKKLYSFLFIILVSFWEKYVLLHVSLNIIRYCPFVLRILIYEIPQQSLLHINAFILSIQIIVHYSQEWPVGFSINTQIIYLPFLVFTYTSEQWK